MESEIAGTVDRQAARCKQLLARLAEAVDAGPNAAALERLEGELQGAIATCSEGLRQQADEEAPLPAAPPSREPPSPISPAALSRKTSSSFAGALPSVWEQDLEPHVEMLRAFEAVDLPAEGMEVSLREAHHLILVIHGIGKHSDFRDAAMSWDGSYGELEGGYFDLKSHFYEMLGPKGALRDLPVSVHFESVEWHEPLRAACNIEEVLRDAAPEGVASLREYMTETVIDGLLYLSTKYGQAIIEDVAAQLNEKYAYFVKTHPGFTGPVSVLAHSLGSMIMFDLLTKTRQDIFIPDLDFEVNILYVAGSPLAYLHLSRGDLFDENGVYRARYFLPDTVRVVNFFHPHDPVAWRLGPLLIEGEQEVGRRRRPSSPASVGRERRASSPSLETRMRRRSSSSSSVAPVPLSQDSEDRQEGLPSEGAGLTAADALVMPYVAAVDGKPLAEILLFFADKLRFREDELQAALAQGHAWGRGPTPSRRPIDFCLPTSRYERAIELALAMKAHSAYWTSAPLVLGVLVTLCEPLLPVLLSYRRKGVALRVTPRRKVISFDRPVLWAERAMIEGPVKGFWKSRLVILQEDGLYVFDKPLSTGLVKGEDIPLLSCQVVAQQDVSPAAEDDAVSAAAGPTSTTTAAAAASTSAPTATASSPAGKAAEDAQEAGTAPPAAAGGGGGASFKLFLTGERGEGGPSRKSVVYEFWCKSQAEMQQWCGSILSAQQRAQQRSLESEEASSKATPAPFQLSGNDRYLFDLCQHGSLQMTASNRWTGKAVKWFTLGKESDELTFWDKAPTVAAERQLDLAAVRVIQALDSQCLLRLVYVGGGALVMRLPSEATLEALRDALVSLCPHAAVEPLHDVLHTQEGEFLQISCRVSGYVILQDAKGDYASFVISVKETGETETARRTVMRRYREFRAFHRQLAAEIEAELKTPAASVLPPLPPTALIATLEDLYLNRQVLKLDGFVRALCRSPLVQQCKTWKAFVRTAPTVAEAASSGQPTEE